MKNSRSDHARRASALACVAAIVLALASGLPSRALAADTDLADDAIAVVAADGRTFAPAPGVVTSSPPFAGTGVLPEGARRSSSPPPEGQRAMEVVSAESVIGADGRIQVTDTTEFPYRAIAYLSIAYPLSSGWFCTGFFIDADTIVTAGHCVYSAEEGGWATTITVYPGRNGASTPYGSALATNFYAVNAWTQDGDQRYDYGALKIDSDLGTTTGWFGYGFKKDDALLGLKSKIYGYPGDKASGTMWGMVKPIKGVAARKLFYPIDTFGGQSGSPVFGNLSRTCKPCAFGIHAYGTGLTPYPQWNSGTRIIEKIFENLTYWAGL